ncbi:hypothetical protein DVH05_002027 [Phytophthora capsici]|nr:hypothetical protein DVH05_002027 [Phytophthora capsici]
MNFSQRVLLLMVLVMMSSCSWMTDAAGPLPISARYANFRERMLQQRISRQAAYEKNEKDFFARKRN